MSKFDWLEFINLESKFSYSKIPDVVAIFPKIKKIMQGIDYWIANGNKKGLSGFTYKQPKIDLMLHGKITNGLKTFQNIQQ